MRKDWYMAIFSLCIVCGCSSSNNSTSGESGAGQVATISCLDSAEMTQAAGPALARNILFIFTEDQGLQLGALGTAGLLTPNMDRLAHSGALMTNAHVTVATCTGSKSSIFTGFSNHNTGAISNVNEFIGSDAELRMANPPWLNDDNSPYNRYRIRDEFPTLIEILQQTGYYTGLHNKFHLSPHSKFPYEHWDSRDSSYIQTLDFIAEAAAQDKPWFLTHVISNSHRPYPNSDTGTIRINPAEVSLPAHLPDTAVSRKDWSEYLAAIEITDYRVGQVLQALNDSQALNQTLVVLMGDHGPAYHRGKFSTYGLGLRAPIIFSGGGIHAGQIQNALFSNVDMLPTLLDFLGLDSPITQGSSFRPLLTSESSLHPRKCVVGEASSDRSIFDGRYRLIQSPDPDDTRMPADNRDFYPWLNRVYSHIVENKTDPAFALAYRLLDLADADLGDFHRPASELYDNLTDPWEINDIAGSAEAAEVRARLEGQLNQWRLDTGDTRK